MKKTLYIATLLFSTGLVFGQSLESAKFKTASERYDEATNEFLQLIKNNPEDVESYFFLGENYMFAEKLDSASYYWQKASELDAKNPLTYVAAGNVLWLKDKRNEASVKYDEAVKVAKRKPAEVYRQIGAFITLAPKKDLTKAINFLKEAVEKDPTNIDGYLLLGDAILAKDPTNGTDAIREYNNAERIEQSPRTIVRKAKLYQGARNYKLADEMYVQAQTLDPKYAPAYKAHAELQGMFARYDLAIKNWEKYLSLNNDNYARYKYAAALYSAKRYCEALKEAKDLEAKKYTSVYISRIDLYSTYECLAAGTDKNDTAKFEAGYKNLLTFIDKYNASGDIIGMDYKYKAMYLTKIGKTDEAVEAYYKAAEDTTVAGEVLLGLAKTFTKQEKYIDAIQAYSKIVASDSNALSLADYFELGRVYFLAKDYANSDRANAYVLKLSPTYSFSFFWRARANVFMDLEREEKTWAAKELYEGYLQNTTPEQQIQYRGMTLEAYKYFGDYYVNSPAKDIEKAKEVWAKVIELDPENEEAYQNIINKLK